MAGTGLSPRVRGNPGRLPGKPAPGGSIPACTGEPSRIVLLLVSAKVYPRVYGGTGGPVGHDFLGLGLSPRVRGNPCGYGVGCPGPRSIPACTGEPSAVGRCPVSKTVYPRVYGGTGTIGQENDGQLGLSPRVRGNPERRHRPFAIRGSIPACTGEPGSIWSADTLRRVYPRVYGGTVAGVAVLPLLVGLSPRVRGNPFSHFVLVISGGSIPACTGEP